MPSYIQYDKNTGAVIAVYPSVDERTAQLMSDVVAGKLPSDAVLRDWRIVNGLPQKLSAAEIALRQAAEDKAKTDWTVAIENAVSDITAKFVDISASLPGVTSAVESAKNPMTDKQVQEAVSALGTSVLTISALLVSLQKGLIDMAATHTEGPK